MPALLGILLTGILFRNINFIHISGEYTQVTAILREISLCVILTRAGLGLDPTALKQVFLLVQKVNAIFFFFAGHLA